MRERETMRRRPYKLYTWWRRGDTGTRSFKTERNAILAFQALIPEDQRTTDVWYEPVKYKKTFIIQNGKRV